MIKSSAIAKKRLDNLMPDTRKEISDYEEKKIRKHSIFKEVTGKEKVHLLDDLFRQNALSFERFVKETTHKFIDQQVAKDAKFFNFNGNSYTQDQLASEFIRQNSEMFRSNDSKHRVQDSNIGVVANYGNTVPILNQGFLGEIGYGTGCGKKILNRLSLMTCGKSFRFVGKGKEGQTELLNQDLVDFGVEQTLSALMKQNFCYGGCALIPAVEGWNDEDYGQPFFYDKYFLKQGSLKKFNVVNRYQVAPVLWNSWDGKSVDYFNSPFYLQYGNLIHESRFIKVTTGLLPEFLAPSYQLWGISTLQLVYKNMLASDIILSAIVNGAVGNSIFVYKSRETSNSNENIEQFLSSRRNPTGLFKILADEEVYVVEMNMNYLEELFLMNFHLIATFIGDNVGAFMGNSDSGDTGKLASNNGSQDAKNWQQNVHQLKVDTGYNNAKQTIGKLIQLNRFGKVDPKIEIEDIPVSYDEYLQMVMIADKEADCVTKNIETLQGLGVKREALVELIQNQARQSPVNIFNTEMQDALLEVQSDDAFMQTNSANSVPKKTDNKPKNNKK